jgi:very-short-patch-repair endonuclease
MRKKPTEWERKLWRLLKCKQLEQYKFRRQVPIDYYIADFVNYEKRLIIELDGSQHMDSAYDKTRDAYLKAQGFVLLRFWNNELDANPEGVAERILEVLKNTPHRRAKQRVDSPAGGEWEHVVNAASSNAVHLISPPNAACHAGVGYYQALLQQLRDEFPDREFTFTLCCGDDPAIAHDALRLGFTSIICDCSDVMAAQLIALADTLGAVVLNKYPPQTIENV